MGFFKTTKEGDRHPFNKKQPKIARIAEEKTLCLSFLFRGTVAVKNPR